MATTIQIDEGTKRQLDAMKESSRQTYEEVIEKMIELTKEDEAELTVHAKQALRKAREDVKRRKVYTTKQLIKELGV